MTGHRLALAALAFVFLTTAIGIGALVGDADLLPPAWGLVEAPVGLSDLPQLSTLAWGSDTWHMDRLTSWWLWASGMGPPPPIHEVAADSGGASGSGWLGGLVDWVADSLAHLVPWQGAEP